MTQGKIKTIATVAAVSLALAGGVVVVVLAATDNLVPCRASCEDDMPDYQPPEQVVYKLSAEGQPGAKVEYTCAPDSTLCHATLAPGRTKWSFGITLDTNDYVWVRVTGPGVSCHIDGQPDDGDDAADSAHPRDENPTRRQEALCTQTLYGEGW